MATQQSELEKFGGKFEEQWQKGNFERGNFKRTKLLAKQGNFKRD